MNQNVTELIHAIASGNAVETESAFQAAMAEKLAPMIDARRIEVAQSLFNSTEEAPQDQSEQEN